MTQFLASTSLSGIQTTVAITLYQTLLQDIFRKWIIFVECCCRCTCKLESTTCGAQKSLFQHPLHSFLQGKKMKSSRMQRKEIKLHRAFTWEKVNINAVVSTDLTEQTGFQHEGETARCFWTSQTTWLTLCPPALQTISAINCYFTVEITFLAVVSRQKIKSAYCWYTEFWVNQLSNHLSFLTHWIFISQQALSKYILPCDVFINSACTA